MSSVTLVEAAKLHQNPLVQGVIENIYTTNRMFEVLPFQAINGNAIKYSRENALGDVQQLGVGGTITAKSPATFTEHTASLIKILGDAEVDKFVEATQSSLVSQKAVQVGSKAKAAGRRYQQLLITGSDANPNEFDGLANLVAPSQTISATGNGQVLTFELLDELIGLVKAKDGDVDYIAMHSRDVRKFNALLRALGGASINDTLTLPSGRQVPVYRGIPILENDFIPVDQTQGAAENASTIFAGCLDDGSRRLGLAGLTAANEAGIVVEDVGTSETKDEEITRVKWYCGAALYNEKALAAITGIVPTVLP